MIVLGISPLDKDATASIVQDGEVLFAAGEERFSRQKHHAGFPHLAIAAGLKATGMSVSDIDLVAYAFLPWEAEAKLIREAMAAESEFLSEFKPADLGKLLADARRKLRPHTDPIQGLKDPNERMEKGALKSMFYKMAGATPVVSTRFARRASSQWADAAIEYHKKWHAELETELGKLGLLDKLKRFEHHKSHAANAYLVSGFERALIVTLDGYGSGLAGSISLGEGGKIQRLHGIKFPHSFGTFYESVTSSLGFHPDRHAGKIVGLAAYGDPEVLADVLLSRMRIEDGDLQIHESLNIYFSRHLTSNFPKIEVAAAYQHVLEIAASKLVKHWIDKTGCDAIVLSGGVTANVKMNQRLHEVDGVKHTFVYPNMGDGGCGTGLALHESWTGGPPKAIDNAYHGPEFSEEEIRAEIEREGLTCERPDNLAAEVARRIHAGEVIARFSGRMEYGPRALGNRSILYHAREHEVNHWLNKRLGRTEFMPFAPVTLWEARERCYKNLEGAEHTAEFMTVTFDCTDWMRENCPAAVHIDGTARPQLIKREKNPGYYDIIQEYEKLSGIPCLINTSFNMHEEPIVCSPRDAVRAFLQGHLDGLVAGPFFVANPNTKKDGKSASAQAGEPVTA